VVTVFHSVDLGGVLRTANRDAFETVEKTEGGLEMRNYAWFAYDILDNGMFEIELPDRRVQFKNAVGPEVVREVEGVKQIRCKVEDEGNGKITVLVPAESCIENIKPVEECFRFKIPEEGLGDG
jgi:hypothetical protein